MVFVGYNYQNRFVEIDISHTNFSFFEKEERDMRIELIRQVWKTHRLPLHQSRV